MSVDHSTYRSVFLGGGGLEIWYMAGGNGNGNATTGSPTLNILRAIPFICSGARRRINQLAINVTSPNPGNARVGIYTNTSMSVLYPRDLLVDSGDIALNVGGVKTVAVDVVVEAGALCWMVHVASVTAGIRCLSESQMLNMLGIATTMPNQMNVMLSVAFPFAALPATFPLGAGLLDSTNPVPAVAYRFTPITVSSHQL